MIVQLGEQLSEVLKPTGEFIPALECSRNLSGALTATDKFIATLASSEANLSVVLPTTVKFIAVLVCLAERSSAKLKATVRFTKAQASFLRLLAESNRRIFLAVERRYFC